MKGGSKWKSGAFWNHRISWHHRSEQDLSDLTKINCITSLTRVLNKYFNTVWSTLHCANSFLSATTWYFLDYIIAKVESSVTLRRTIFKRTSETCVSQYPHACLFNLPVFRVRLFLLSVKWKLVRKAREKSEQNWPHEALPLLFRSRSIPY